MNHELNEKGNAGVADAGNKKRLREFYRSRRPEYYSDSENLRGSDPIGGVEMVE